MVALSNPKHEAFCQAFVRGKTAGNATASYKVAGFKGDRRKASRLRQQEDIGRRIEDIQGQVSSIEAAALAKACEKLAISKERVLGELAKLGFSNMLDYIRVTDDGDPIVDFSRLDRDTAAAVQEVVVDSYEEGRGEDARTVKRVRFKLAEKRGALVDLGKHLGLFVDIVKTPDIADALRAFVDKPPAETYEQWQDRRKRELAGRA